MIRESESTIPHHPYNTAGVGNRLEPPQGTRLDRQALPAARCQDAKHGLAHSCQSARADGLGGPDAVTVFGADVTAAARSARFRHHGGMVASRCLGALLLVCVTSCSGNTGDTTADCHPGADFTVVAAGNLPQATGALVEAEVVDAATGSACDGAWSTIRVSRFYGGNDPAASVDLRPGMELRVREQGPVRGLAQIGEGNPAIVILEPKDGEDWKLCSVRAVGGG